MRNLPLFLFDIYFVCHQNDRTMRVRVFFNFSEPTWGMFKTFSIGYWVDNHRAHRFPIVCNGNRSKKLLSTCIIQTCCQLVVLVFEISRFRHIICMYLNLFAILHHANGSSCLFIFDSINVALSYSRFANTRIANHNYFESCTICNFNKLLLWLLIFDHNSFFYLFTFDYTRLVW